MAKKQATAKKPINKAATKKGAKKKASTKSAKKSGGKRELVSPKGDARYVRRNAQGEFNESDDVGRSQASDRKKKAKRTVKAGQGDRGDRKKR